VRPAGWLPDPLDDALVRYWDGQRWTFRTAMRRAAATAPARPAEQPSPPPTPALRPDVARALERVRGALVGSMKEVNLLGGYLGAEEEVLALTGAHGEGMGVLACTNHRVLFLFVGIVRKQFLQVSWNQAKGVVYTQSTKVFAVYTTKPTKRAIPAMAVRVANLADAQALAQAPRSHPPHHDSASSNSPSPLSARRRKRRPRPADHAGPRRQAADEASLAVVEAPQSWAGVRSATCSASVSPGPAPSTWNGPVCGLTSAMSSTSDGRSVGRRSRPENASSVHSRSRVPGAIRCVGAEPPKVHAPT
jgi:hypothetical protein